MHAKGVWLPTRADACASPLFPCLQELLCSGQGKEILAKLVNAQRIPFVAIDEVHCLSSWGSVAHAPTSHCKQRADGWFESLI